MLQDLLVIELASVLAGPSVGMFLAEQGARVIKVENPHTGGDITRSWKLPSEPAETDVSAYFSSINWGKESIVADLRQADDLAWVRRMIAQADIVLSSYIPGSSQKWGLDADALLAQHPSLIIAEISGYGQAEARAAFDAIIQAEAGFTYLNGTPGQSFKMPVALMDILAGHQLKEAILLALIKRMQTGKGSHVHVSLLQSGIASLANQATNWLVAGSSPQPKGSDHPNIVPYGTQYATADEGRIVLAVGTDAQFMGLCKVLGISPPAAYLTNTQRVAARSEVNGWLSAAIQQRNRDELLQALRNARVPAGAVNDIPQALNQSEAKDLLLTGRGLKGLRGFVAEGMERRELSPPPTLGEHQEKIEAEFGPNETI